MYTFQPLILGGKATLKPANWGQARVYQTVILESELKYCIIVLFPYQEEEVK